MRGTGLLRQAGDGTRKGIVITGSEDGQFGKRTDGTSYRRSRNKKYPPVFVGKGGRPTVCGRRHPA